MFCVFIYVFLCCEHSYMCIYVLSIYICVFLCMCIYILCIKPRVLVRPTGSWDLRKIPSRPAGNNPSLSPPVLPPQLTRLLLMMSLLLVHLLVLLLFLWLISTLLSTLVVVVVVLIVSDVSISTRWYAYSSSSRHRWLTYALIPALTLPLTLTLSLTLTLTRSWLIWLRVDWEWWLACCPWTMTMRMTTMMIFSLYLYPFYYPVTTFLTMTMVVLSNLWHVSSGSPTADIVPVDPP